MGTHEEGWGGNSRAFTEIRLALAFSAAYLRSDGEALRVLLGNDVGTVPPPGTAEVLDALVAALVSFMTKFKDYRDYGYDPDNLDYFEVAEFLEQYAQELAEAGLGGS